MKTLKKLSLTITALLTVISLFSAYSSVALADNPSSPSDCVGASENSTCGGGPSGNTSQNNPNCSNSSDAGISKCLSTNPITKDLNTIVNFLGAGVGIVVAGVIILGGIQYSLAGDNPSATGAAKQRIINGLIALVAFLFTYSFLQWLIPGGVFG